jgi:hypothetical protein
MARLILILASNVKRTLRDEGVCTDEQFETLVSDLNSRAYHVRPIGP